MLWRKDLEGYRDEDKTVSFVEHSSLQGLGITRTDRTDYMSIGLDHELDPLSVE